MMKFRTVFLCLCAAVLFFSSCLDLTRYKKYPEINTFILNQGNYGAMDASISIVRDHDDMTVINNAFEKSNGEKLNASSGVDLTLSAYNTMYILTSGPDMIFIVDAENMEHRGTISTGMDMPRAFFCDSDRMYVVNYGSETEDAGGGMYDYTGSFLCVYDLRKNTLIDTLKIGTNAEDILCFDNRAYVTVKEGVLVLDISNAAIAGGIRKIALIESENGAPKQLQYLTESKLAVSYPDKGIGLIDTESNVISGFHEMKIDYDGMICTDASGNNVYTNYRDYAAGTSSVYVLDLDDGSVTELFTGTNIYGFGINPFSNEYYVCDVKSFNSPTELTVYDKDKNVVFTHALGSASYRLVYNFKND